MSLGLAQSLRSLTRSQIDTAIAQAHHMARRLLEAGDAPGQDQRRRRLQAADRRDRIGRPDTIALRFIGTDRNRGRV